MEANTVIDAPTEADLRRATIEDVEATVDHLAMQLVKETNKYGYDIQETKDLGLLVEVLKSILLRTMDVPHFFQTYADKNVTLTD